MPDKTEHASRQRSAVKRIREGEHFSVTLPILGSVKLPRPEELAYYGALTALAAAEIIEWPIALILATGHALANNHHSRIAQELGEALDEA
ncbi:hypothetical protein [Mycolicibacterium sp. P1-5]|uniref:hypothetical protein n=1 Tax=Mycolicibacterium sp. P1-5 TaxID=2024617 RepID=UPI0011ECA3F1|nr:hypothetical protein [Mycolicibacterium sp. P1-5]KAA0107899.1 hypothetical protein CIW47_16475 [Mycolicibacterium sp. P1-5]